MVDLAASQPAAETSVFDRARALGRFKTGDDVFRLLTLGAAILVLLLLGGVIGSLVWGSLPIFQAAGWRFITSTDWDPVNDSFGAATAIFGTLVTSIIALVIALPVAVGIALLLSGL